MTKYILIAKDNKYKNKLEFESDDLSEVVANLEIFLKGGGFFFEGVLDIHTGKVETNAMHHVYTNEDDDDDTGRQSQETS